MDRNAKAIFMALEVILLAGVCLGAAAVCGNFEPKYSCDFGRSTATLAAQFAAIAMIFGSVGILYIKNKAIKAKTMAVAIAQPELA